MAYKNLFVDSDVILDMTLQREPFYRFSQLLFVDNRTKFELSTSTLVIANVNYLLGRHIGKIPVRNSIKLLMNEVNILSCERSDIEDALNSSFADFEDAIQHSVAKRYNCDVFITRNTKDYKHSAIPVMTAEQFLRTIYKA